MGDSVTVPKDVAEMAIMVMTAVNGLLDKGHIAMREGVLWIL